jgi:hypothetical protein
MSFPCEECGAQPGEECNDLICTAATDRRHQNGEFSDLTTLPVSSVPAAFDRGHLYSPTADVVAYGIDHRPGDQFEPMPASPRGNPPAWAEWWRTVALVAAPDFLGLKAGGDITVQHPCSVGTGAVMATYRFGALVRCPTPEGAEKPYADMYVRSRNQFGHWY